MGGMKGYLGDDLFSYPTVPGFKEPSTSREAAVRMTPSAASLREVVLGQLNINRAGMTADEIAHALDRSILSIRPRVSELFKMGKIKRAPERRKNESGMSAAVWILVP
jgi:hypothetical protein